MICVNYTEKLVFRIEIDDQYPFRCPNVFINNIPHCEYIQNRMKTMNGLTTLLDVPCPCCYNILNSWSPAYYLSNIFQEFESTLVLMNIFQKMNYVNKYIIKKFKNCDNVFILRLIYNYLE